MNRRKIREEIFKILFQINFYEEEELSEENEVINSEEINNQQSVDLGNNSESEFAEDMPAEDGTEVVEDDLDMDLEEDKSEEIDDEI